MESWSNLCRCCLSPYSEVSLIDEELNVREKFLEVTTIEVDKDDGLPQMLCDNCYTTMNSAYQFRKQCIKMDSELKLQHEVLLRHHNETETNNVPEKDNVQEDCNEEVDPMTELLSIIKKEPSDSDDDCYYVLVIDDPKDKDNDTEEALLSIVKQENTVKDKQEEHEIFQPTGDKEKVFENTYDFLNTKVPANVPATILENEEESPENDENIDNAMELDETQNSNSQEPEHIVADFEETQDNTVAVQISGNLNDLQHKNSIYKILSSAGTDGTIVLKSEDGSIQYLTDTQLVTHDDDDGDPMNQEQVIFCEGDDPSQFQILKCDSSELIIEYAGTEQIATVLQQEDGTFLCDCGDEFEDLAEYEKHQHQHNPAGDNLCNLCGKGFESAEILTGHMLLHSVTGLYVTCPFCSQLIRRNTLTQHIKQGHNNIRPQCSVCDKTFANSNNLKRHMMIHTGIREFECDVCLKRFHQKITMQTHRLTHVNQFACNECDKTFRNNTELTEHKESNECSKSTVKKVKEALMKTVRQEITTSLGKLLGYACSLCKKMFSMESALEQHVENTHMVDPSELLCSECGIVVPSKKDMQSHMMTHKNYIKRHSKRFECSECNKGCSSQAMLLMHERVHTNERPYPCGLCSLRFKTKTHLRTHQLTHTREKKFGCSVCMKFFALKGNLVVHLRTHTGERPYVCTLCAEAFIDSKYLKKHKLKKHAIDNVPWNQY